jgi:hypothetical protein
MQSLLGQFYSRIKGSQEDIASEGLNYILQRSKAARLAVNKMLKNDCNLQLDDLSFVTQNTGEKLERPDISGFDTEGKEVLILEAKFWAALTENQPIEYLNRLGVNTALVFICPALRKRSVFEELFRRVKSMPSLLASNPEENLITFQNNKFLLMKTWDEILGMVKIHLIQDNKQLLISDIDQIIGFCNTIDNNAFLPIQPEELSPKFAKRINSYYDIVDQVTVELKKRSVGNTAGLNATPQRFGYTRYIRTNSLGLSLNLHFNNWASRGDTPFWINIKNNISTKVWSVTNEFKGKCKIVASQLGYTIHETNTREFYFALFPELNETEDRVVKNLCDQIVRLIKALEGGG